MAHEGSLRQTPTTRQGVRQAFLLEPLNGPKDVHHYLARFPEEIYDKSPSSRLYKLMFTLLGDTGVNLIRKNTLQARLLLEELGLELFDLERFFGDPFAFGRIAGESLDFDPEGLIPKEDWDRVLTKNARYRNRALDFISGARAGNTPEGMRLVARSGLGHDAEIIENYKWLYDQHSDDPLNLHRYGKTTFVEEFTILPRRELSRSEVQLVSINGNPDPPDGGFVILEFNGEAATIPWNANAREVREALEALDTVGKGNVDVWGGPGPNAHWEIEFVRALANRDVPEINPISALTSTSGSYITVSARTLVGGRDSVGEVVEIPAADQHHLFEAINRIKPMTTLATVGEAEGLVSRNNWVTAFASSEYTQVLRYVTGNPVIPWPALDRDNPWWIEAGKEKLAPRLPNDRQQHYQCFHRVMKVRAFTDYAVNDPAAFEASDTHSDNFRSVHSGTFHTTQAGLFPFLQEFGKKGQQDPSLFVPEQGLPDGPHTPTVRVVDSLRDGKVFSYVDGIYPVDYLSLPNVPRRRTFQSFWASAERTAGDEYLEIDLGQAQAVNYLSFEISKKPVDFAISYDLLDQAPTRDYAPVTLNGNAVTSVGYVAESNPWQQISLSFTNAKSEMIYTRFILLRFERRVPNPFVSSTNGVQHPWTIEVRNLRIGRNVVQ